jgi:hypothetical protein
MHIQNILKLILAAFVLTLILKIAAVALLKFSGHITAFDDAVSALIHYPKSIKGVFALFAAILFVCSLELLLYPSDLGAYLREWVFIPALRISEHMFSLSTGVLFAWWTIGLWSGELGTSHTIWSTFLTTIFACLLLTSLAAACSFTAEFLERDLERILSRLGRWRFLILSISSTLVIYAVLQDTVWSYTPDPNTTHK